jgi:hypothetical protein
MEREATSGYHLLNSPLVRSVQIPSGKCRTNIPPKRKEVLLDPKSCYPYDYT